MFLYDYKQSEAIHAEQRPFYALIMAAMLQADTLNAHKLRAAWPEVWNELQARYNAPGGYLPGESAEAGEA